jgi:Signal transduction histidine kinase
MGKSYFIWIALHLLVWPAALHAAVQDLQSEYWRLIFAAGYFVVFFLTPVLARRPAVLTVLSCLSACLAAAALYPLDGEAFNPYLLLVYALLTGETAQRLPLARCVPPAAVQAACVGWLAARTELSPAHAVFAALFMLLLFAAAARHQVTREREAAAQARYDALLGEYRGLKRRLTSEEELARQEERALISREIHDSVGHKLTALVMQLEAYRLKAREEDRDTVAMLKQLAQDSLEETRRAVRNYKSGETGGLPAVIRLIRNLESERFLRIHFTVHHGAFSAPLNGEQSFTIYRAVQEAMTNIMKHSKAREARVLFEAPGGSIFRFEISNPIGGPVPFREGFGLASMRERLERIGGGLEVFTTADQFCVRGWFRLHEEAERGT